ncbi:MAG: hypothetical protein JXB49_29735 [Bacteroidales bacterium]|nr:hypothetical protein [Bacteroidales bacterium]
MGYRRATKIKCTKPELFYTGSTFNKEWKDFIFNVKDGVTEYYCRKDYLNNAIIELSIQHPEVTFTGVTWIDDDYYDSIDYTYIVKNGDLKVVKKEPHYQFLFPVIEDDEYDMLASKFIDHVRQYLERIDVIHTRPNEATVFDFLNDKEDHAGFRSYFTITWENKEHKFTATKRFTSHVIVDYQRKNPIENEELKIGENLSDDDQDDMYDNLPF